MSAASKRRPTVLVTDARDPRPRTAGGSTAASLSSGSRPADLVRRGTSRLITVDNVLQYASDIPSAQQRFPANRPITPRTKSGRPAAPRLAGRLMPSHLPARSTKVSEKLVLLPDTDRDEDEPDEKGDYDEDNEISPERDDELERRRHKIGAQKGKSYAERLPKSRRADKLARCTAYCTAQAYKLPATAAVLRDTHGARAKLYDDCLYAVFHLPLLPGRDGFRVRSSPILKSPGGKAVLDEQIERSEQRDYAEGYFEPEDQAETYSVRGEEEDDDMQQSSPGRHADRGNTSDSIERPPSPQRKTSNSSTRSSSPSRGAPDATAFAEMFVFGYGVVVFWNFTARQEIDTLADLTFSSSKAVASPITDKPKSKLSPSLSPLASNLLLKGDKAAVAPTQTHHLVLNPLPEDEFETEEFHFEYSSSAPRPRMYNDMITLRSGDHMVKLTISHAIAQSTKLSLFEQRMATQMENASPIPRSLALSGNLGIPRRDVLRILGALYRTRVEVNLSEPVLDTPQFFWQSEPPLHPLYAGVREYLEITPRVKVLNERCGVFLDLAEMLSEGIADARMSSMTWGVILLIAVSIVVTCTEVFLRFGLISAGHGPALAVGGNSTVGGEVRGVMKEGVCWCPAVRPAGDLLGEEIKVPGMSGAEL